MGIEVGESRLTIQEPILPSGVIWIGADLEPLFISDSFLLQVVRKDLD